MELTTLKLLFAGGVLVIAAAIMLLLLAIQRLKEWVKSRGERAVVRPLSGTTGRGPGPASERVLRSGHAGWRTLL